VGKNKNQKQPKKVFFSKLLDRKVTAPVSAVEQTMADPAVTERMPNPAIETDAKKARGSLLRRYEHPRRHRWTLRLGKTSIVS
jgi:hypothetical protein